MWLNSSWNSKKHSIDNNKHIQIINFYAYSKYIKFSMFNMTHQTLWAWKKFPIFGEGKKAQNIKWSRWKSHHHIQHTVKPCCRGLKLLYTKMWNFVFSAKRKITNMFFFQGNRIISVILEYQESVHLIINQMFYCPYVTKSIGGHLAFLSQPVFVPFCPA